MRALDRCFPLFALAAMTGLGAFLYGVGTLRQAGATPADTRLAVLSVVGGAVGMALWASVPVCLWWGFA